MYVAGGYVLYPAMDKSRGFRVDDILGRAQSPRPLPPPPPTVASRDLKFGIDTILSSAVATGSKKESQSPFSSPPSPICSLSCSTCISRCCSITSCRCNAIIEPYPLYPYQTTVYPKYGAHALIHYPNSVYSGTDYELRLGSVGSTGAHHPGATGKRKRSWSRAVFSNLQRKGLEKRFQIQKYITKPDRRQLAATLGLTDAQVKVWFQNRRMKWRHSKEAREQFKNEKKVDERSDVTSPHDNSDQIVSTTV